MPHAECGEKGKCSHVRRLRRVEAFMPRSVELFDNSPILDLPSQYCFPLTAA